MNNFEEMAKLYPGPGVKCIDPNGMPRWLDYTQDCNHLTELSENYILCGFTHRAMSNECPRIKSKCAYFGEKNA